MKTTKELRPRHAPARRVDDDPAPASQALREVAAALRLAVDAAVGPGASFAEREKATIELAAQAARRAAEDDAK